MITLIPITQSQVDWHAYLSITNETLGRSPTSALDKSWHKLTNTLAEFIATLKEVDCEGADPFNDAGALLDHVSMSFILVAPKSITMSIVMRARVNFTTVDTKLKDFSYTVMSGTLNQWRSALLNCCIDDVEVEVRSFGTKLLEHFEKAKLRQLLCGLAKIQMRDGTVRLKLN